MRPAVLILEFNTSFVKSRLDTRGQITFLYFVLIFMEGQTFEAVLQNEIIVYFRMYMVSLVPLNTFYIP